VLNPTNCDTATATVTVGGCLDFAVNDCDNDGESNGTEASNGTDPSNPCSYTNAPATTSAAYATWSVLDCDGDGTPNGTDLNPKDPCIHAAGATPVFTNPIWAAADCDNDGESNGTETTNGTDPNNSCSYTNFPASTSAAYAFWSELDCDGDGVINGTEVEDGTDETNPCESISAHGTFPLSETFLEGDCDDDGLTNGEEIGLDPTKPNDSNNNGISDYLEVNSHTESEDDLEIFNAVTPNGNGENDVFTIRNIELYPNNTLTIFNRWGIVVYEADGYGQNNTYFKGISEGRSTINKSEELPIGTYFYVLRYLNSNGISKQRSGYLYLNK
jgi:gliding motility-associated-like protein